jgi:UPF0755 protein
MRLQSDPTVRFVLAGNGATKFDGTLTRAELEVNSPYNTYVARGLPPGPICSPGKAALRDAVRPERSDDLYFVADGSGGHVFARTLVEHNRNIATYMRAPPEATPANPPPAAPAQTAADPQPAATAAAPQTAGTTAAPQTAQHCRASPGHPCVVR